MLHAALFQGRARACGDLGIAGSRKKLLFHAECFTLEDRAVRLGAGAAHAMAWKDANRGEGRRTLASMK